MSCSIKNVSHVARSRGVRALESQLSAQFISARYFRINFTGPRALEPPTVVAGSERGNEEEGEMNVSAISLW